MKALTSLLLLVLLAAPAALAQYYNPHPNPYTSPYGTECEDPYYDRESRSIIACATSNRCRRIGTSSSSMSNA